MATHSSVLAWRIPGMGKPGGLPSLGLHTSVTHGDQEQRGRGDSLISEKPSGRPSSCKQKQQEHDESLGGHWEIGCFSLLSAQVFLPIHTFVQPPPFVCG